jgi:hypothetical protein
MPLQVTLERAGQGGRGQAGDLRTHGGGRPLRERHRAVGKRRLRMGRDVVPRYLGQHAGLDPEKRADPVQALLGLVHQQPVAQDQHLLPREQGEQVLELLAVTAEPDVVPEAGPAGRDPVFLLRAGRDEVPDGLQAG